MKSTFFFLISLIPITNYSQISDLNNGIGVKAGLNYANLRGDETHGFKSRLSYNFGIFSEFRALRNLSVQPELQFSSQGGKFNLSGVDVAIVLNYLNVPILAKYYIINNFYGQLGPQFSYLLSSELKAEGQDQGLGELNKFDLALNGGFGYQLSIFWNAGWSTSEIVAATNEKTYLLSLDRPVWQH